MSSNYLFITSISNDVPYPIVCQNGFFFCQNDIQLGFILYLIECLFALPYFIIIHDLLYYSFYIYH